MKEKVYQYSLCLFAFSMAFEPDWSSKTLILTSFFALFNIKFNREVFKKLPFAILCILALYVVLNIVFITREADFSFFPFLGLLFLFFLLFTNTSIEIKSKEWILFSFVAGVFVVGLFNLFFSFFRSSGAMITFFNSWETTAIIDIQKIYYAMYLNMAYAICLVGLQKGRIKYRLVYITILTALTVVLLIYSGAMSGIILFVVINALMLLQLAKKWVRFFFVISFITFPMVFLLLLSKQMTQDFFSQIDGENSRIRNYNVNMELILAAPIFGYGLGKERQTMQANRNEKSWEYKNNYHAHNQYFESLLGGG
ncbi:O-antigen ligase family protein [Maribacter cobaltidurans]|uniref:O-antigen ligase-related domain-containing protein n=2 Tax=Maribacter cobaltidurans TaxID=1178778 RepID=A0A223V439_9FLAO|nr:O-antigen ligase family protein [Maribacter cobaltidurans]ASV30183.1 hypothetical protein CJ263_08090 [Maribacter cobaltidurans]